MTTHAVLFVRWVLLGLATLAVVAAVVVARRTNGAGTGLGERYRCPMHPQVTALGPGECPICRMTLEPVDRRLDPSAPATSAHGSPPGDAAHGGYVVRSVVFTDNVRAPAWVESPGMLTAHLYLDEIASLEPGARGVFSPSVAPAVHEEATLSDAPPSPWDCCTSLVHLRVAPSSPPLKQGAMGWLRFAPKMRHEILIPSSAVLQSPDGPYVLAATPDQRAWEPRSVRLGKVFFGQALVLSGVGEHESVAVNGLFFLDAERRLRLGAGAHEASVDSAR